MEHAAKLAPEGEEALTEIRAHWLSRLAHDFRGPLFAARGYTKLILDDRDSEVTANQRRYLENISESLNRMAALVEALREFPSDQTLNLEEIELGEVLRSCAENCHQSDPTLHVETNFPAGRVVTAADRAKLVAAVRGLLTTAVEFAGPGGDVRLHARSEDGELTARFSASGKTFSQVLKKDTQMWCDILRLHGGTANVDDGREGFLHVTIRLPIVRSASFQQEGK